MPNRLYNKQVTPKGYKMGGRAKKAEGGSLSDRLDDSSKMTKKGEILLQKRRNLKPSQKRKFETTPIGKKPSRPIRPKPLTKRKPTRIMGEEVKGFKRGGALKPVDPKTQKGLSKLPTEVRNKMGYMKKGGKVNGK